MCVLFEEVTVFLYSCDSARFCSTAIQMALCVCLWTSDFNVALAALLFPVCVD